MNSDYIFKDDCIQNCEKQYSDYIFKADCIQKCEIQNNEYVFSKKCNQNLETQEYGLISMAENIQKTRKHSF